MSKWLVRTSATTTLVLLILLIVQYNYTNTATGAPTKPNASNQVYLPLAQKQSSSQPPPTPPPTDSSRRINVPFFSNSIWDDKTAVLWFGQVTHDESYTDVRMGYTSTELYIKFTVIDRNIWFNTTPPAPSSLITMDAISLYLSLGGNSGSTPQTNSYRFDAQFTDWQDRSTGGWQTAYKGNGTAWISASVPFTTESAYRGDAGPNSYGDNRGWVMVFHIPFSSLGLSSTPAAGTIWGLGATLYNRNYNLVGGNPVSSFNTKIWPESLVSTNPGTWGQMRVGIPTYTPPSGTSPTTVVIRHGTNGANVPDGMVGGAFNCGDGLDFFTQWGNANYFNDVNKDQFNVQNQTDVADFPCFSKYYATFPLSSVPTSKVIISSTLTLREFGNSGQGQTPTPQPSYIQVMTINEDWNESTINWNNAPLSYENFASLWVNPMTPSDPYYPGVARTWDVTRAVAQAYAESKPLRLVIYSADGSQNSGKYFYSSDHNDTNVRPRLEIIWGNP